MFKVFNFKQKKADKLHDLGQQLDAQGHEEEAIEKYKQAIRLDPSKSESYYNIGLIYKYRNDWEKSFEYNKKANELNNEDQAARWNLGIAATALRDWKTARKAWLEDGINLGDGDGPINCDFGLTPVRLNPNGNAEVVWAKRIDPVRAEIVSVPLPESGFCSGDIVLHDGAAVGYRKYGESERPVFNVLELFNKSNLSTFKAVIKVSEQSDIDILESLLGEKDMVTEDWTTNYRILCKACSEGTPHEEHDTDDEKEWVPEHAMGIAAKSQHDIDEVINKWSNNTSRQVINLSCVYSRE